ncbi:MAG TPA: hypothetical protein DD490_18435 [Acidobacteria bacterium]|nr:hypothetical protein [Acidobacteriota bacterium]
MWRKTIPGLLLLWCALSFALEMARALEGWDRRGITPRSPSTWRFGSPQLERLATCLGEVRRRVPPGRTIAYAAPVRPGAEKNDVFFRALWAAYLLPGDDVLPIQDPAAAQVAQYVVDDRAGLDLARLELVAQLTGCRLFRVLPPSPAPSP